MSGAIAFRVAALLGALAVGLGAFGAHGLKAFLEQNGATANWQTAVFYHFIHALVLLVLAQREPLRSGPWFALLAGILLFSGSLYAYSLTKIHWLVFVTPIGGLSFLVGWLWLAFGRLGR